MHNVTTNVAGPLGMLGMGEQQELTGDDWWTGKMASNTIELKLRTTAVEQPEPATQADRAEQAE